ncbi:hypothetical protein MRB53_030814 [Persea americana]|uniref:Uncharacterized protein n=1 Tax=Persea americana TaxID=3435 RepID=A0ACC2KMP2_PERAE|nr:hypothetical protein MRB53_030814 [Persea americana]
MGLGCVLEVDVNGEEVFLVDKKILSSFSGRLSKLFSKSTMTAGNLKVLFHDLPGGAEAFELMARFCYNSGSISITPSNVCLLHCIAHFMEMTEGLSGSSPNLIEQTEKTLEGIAYWTWSEILITLKQCQNLFPVVHSLGILKKCLDSLVGRIALVSDISPSTSSPDSSTGFRFSCDTRSTESTKNSYNRNSWFEDLAVLNIHIIEKMIETMIFRNIDQVIISRFLFYFLKFQLSKSPSSEKCKIMEIVVELLFSLDNCSVSCKGLFGILQVASNANISKCHRSRLENMIGLLLDQATLDNLLVPAPIGVKFLYDVNLVMRFLRSFLANKGPISLTRLRKIGRLMDMYIAEVAPDPCLKPSKFIALLMALPDSARDIYDGIYQAVDMYLEVHTGLSEKEKMKICCALNYQKLSSDACQHLVQNPRFPSRTATQALLLHRSKFKNLLQDTDHPKSFNTSPCTYGDKASAKNEKQIALYADKLCLTVESEKIKSHLQGMQWRVMELEKVCKRLQTRMGKLMKAKIPSPGNPKSLPKMCR